jgi:hypothetical protein
MSYQAAKFQVHLRRLAQVHIVLFLAAYLFMGMLLSIEAQQVIYFKLAFIICTLAATLMYFIFNLSLFFLPSSRGRQGVAILSLITND